VDHETIDKSLFTLKAYRDRQVIPVDAINLYERILLSIKISGLMQPAYVYIGGAVLYIWWYRCSRIDHYNVFRFMRIDVCCPFSEHTNQALYKQKDREHIIKLDQDNLVPDILRRLGRFQMYSLGLKPKLRDRKEQDHGGSRRTAGDPSKYS
jgi:hypothetical protein